MNNNRSTELAKEAQLYATREENIFTAMAEQPLIRTSAMRYSPSSDDDSDENLAVQNDGILDEKISQRHSAQMAESANDLASRFEVGSATQIRNMGMNEETRAGVCMHAARFMQCASLIFARVWACSLWMFGVPTCMHGVAACMCACIWFVHA